MARLLGADPGIRFVYAAQQIYADYRWSVVGKLLTLKQLEQAELVLSCVLWSDIDRSGSDKLSTGFASSIDDRGQAVHLVAKPARAAETRFVAVETARLREAAAKLESSLLEGAPDRAARRRLKERLAPIRRILVEEHHATLRDVNAALTRHLLERHLGLAPRCYFVSELLEFAPVLAGVELAVNQLDKFIEAYNEAVEELLAHGIDPQVAPRRPDVLPLFYSPAQADGRCRLHREVDGQGVTFAVAQEASGEIHRFRLGAGRLSIGALAATRRWSPDVALPLFLSGLFSGMVVGRSSALYGLVLNRVAERVFGKRGIPMLVQDAALDPADHGFARDSLLYSHLSAHGPAAD